MAHTKNDIESTYPLPVYNYKVEIDGMEIGFSEVSGITIEHETVTYRHGLSFWEGEGIQKYYYPKYVTITLKKGTVKGKNDLFEWVQGKGSRNVIVSLCDTAGKPVVSWNIKVAIPVKLEAPTFDARSNDVSIESLELLASKITIEHHNGVAP